jgi:hypothetical protein
MNKIYRRHEYITHQDTTTVVLLTWPPVYRVYLIYSRHGHPDIAYRLRQDYIVCIDPSKVY